MRLLLRHQACLVLVAVLIFMTNLGGYALFNEDEPKNATCGAEMFRRGDWLVPTFNESLRTDKPILVYWLMLVSYTVFGVSEFSARFASSLLSVGTTLLTYHLGRKLYSAEIGFFASLILCTSLLFSAVGRASTPDATLIFFITLAFTCYVWVVAWQRNGNFSGGEQDYEPQQQAVEGSTLANATDVQSAGSRVEPRPIPMNWRLATPFFLAIGFAVLAKGPVGVVLPAAILVLFLLITFRERDQELEKLKRIAGPWWRRGGSMLRQLFGWERILEAVRGMHFGIGFGIVLAVALPWYLAVGIKTDGNWLRGFFLDHNLGRALSAKENHNGFPFYSLYYLVVIHLSCFPWSVFLPVAVYRLKERFGEHAIWRDSDRLVACWGAVWFLFFSLASTKLPNYLLPMYPAVALILARYFSDWKREEIDSGVYSFNLCCRAMGIVGILMVIGVYIAAFLLFEQDQWLGLIGFIPLIGAFVAVKFLDREQRHRVLQTLGITAILLAILIVGIAPARIHRYQDSPQFIADARKFAGRAEIEIGTYRYFQPSVVFYAGKRITVLQTPREVADFLADHPYGYVITRVEAHNELRDDLPVNVSELSRHRNFLKRDELILLGRQ